MGQKQGYELEAQLVEQHQWMAAQGQAIMFKVPDNAKITGGAKGARTVKAVRQGRVWVDFAGLLWGSAQAVALEAKATNGVRWSAASVASEFQLGVLAQVANCGGFAALYVRRLSPEGLALADYLLPYNRAGMPMFPLKCAWEAPGAELDLRPWLVESGESWLMAAQRLARLHDGIKLELWL